VIDTDAFVIVTDFRGTVIRCIFVRNIPFRGTPEPVFEAELLLTSLKG
jgi:hypothetical protein